MNLPNRQPLSALSAPLVLLAFCSPLAGRAATVLEVLPLTDRIVLVHFDEGRVVHSQLGQPWGQETVQVSLLDVTAASRTNSYQITSTNDPVYASALRPV